MTGSPTEPRAFELTGPLPSGTAVLEASAGTGKTFTIAALAARYVAEGLATIDELMIVTFGRAATSELRDRVRERLATAAAALADPVAARADEDALVRHLAAAGEQEIALRARRLRAAVAGFDAATITTTHGFCAQMLTTLGLAADLDSGIVLAESTADLRAEVVADCYVRTFCAPGEPPTAALEPKPARAAAREAVADPHARLEPEGPPGSQALARRQFGEQVRAEMRRRKQERRVIDYDDLLGELRDALCDPDAGEAARARVRGRYRVVLVDEFQDTDPVQWQILRDTFAGKRTLVLIGDPKQAIYAFRGGDVVTYLDATRVAGSTATLSTNHRTDAPLVQALGALFDGAALGDPRIRARAVQAGHTRPRLTDAAGGPVGAPLRLRVVPRAQPDKALGVAAARETIVADLVAEVVALLDSGARLRMDGEPERELRPADIAVLVYLNAHGEAVRDALRAAGIPVVLAGTSSIFASPAAADWVALLRALDGADREPLVRAAALTSFVGWDVAALADADEQALEALGDRCRAWADVLSRDGVAALWEVLRGGGLVAAVLSRPGGERMLTDLRHIAQALHATAHTQQLGVSALTTWLEERIAEAGPDEAPENSRRLDTDAQAVQVLTIHRAKGLQFPVVFTPFLWDRFLRDEPESLRLHDAAGARVVDVGGPAGTGRAERKAQARVEDDGESLRLAYVALTRARCAVVTWWAPTARNTGASPLHRLLFAPRGPDGMLPGSSPVPADDAVAPSLAGLLARAGAAITLEPVRRRGPVMWRAARSEPPPIEVRRFDRTLDRLWTRTSYSGITAGTHAAVPTSEPEDPGTTDEPDEPPPEAIEVAAPAPDADPSLPSPFAGLPAGPAFGTAVHRVLEAAEFTAPDLLAHLGERCAAERTERFAGVEAAALAAALVPALTTPLGPGTEPPLASVAAADRRNEMAFELPLAGGDRPAGAVSVGAIADLLRQHLPAEDPLAGYPDDLALLAGHGWRGFLTGSLDLVLRLRPSEGSPSDPGGGDEPRYLVIDYKTNLLGPRDGLTTAHYAPAAMTAAMRANHYPLQALLYCVAVHRYLRWRQPAYDPDRHLAGVAYLFLRGMAGPRTPVQAGMRCGVFLWRPPAALVTDLSDLLDRGDPGRRP